MIWLPVVGNYADIDVYASTIAYADLLNQRGKPAKTYIPSKPNYSVPNALRLPEYENTVFDFYSSDQAIILDLSEPDIIHEYVSDDQILELIDHHPGYEEYWEQRLGDRAIIEKIGAVATSIYEWWGECWTYDKMSTEIAKLLLAAILDNTLNFNAQITTERDRKAASSLASIAVTTIEDFTEWYFSTVSHTILTNLSDSLLQDYKKTNLPKKRLNFDFYQLVIWDSRTIISQADEIAKIASPTNGDWVVNVLCISERRNYILTNSKQLSKYFTNLLNLKEKDAWLVSNQLFLRKEILSKMLDNQSD